MAKSQQSWNKQEKEKSRQKKKKDKEAKKQERQASARDGSNMDEMIAYVDEYGRITSTPPDPTATKGVIKAEDIEISVRNKNSDVKDETPKTGTVTFFNNAKAYGFIKDSITNDSYFVHANALESAIKEGDLVTFQVEKTFKGLSAIGVKVIKK